MAQAIRKQLTCPACGAIIAEAAYQGWRGKLVLTSIAGYQEQPLGIGVLLRITENELSTATTALERAEAEDRMSFLRRNIGDLVYDLKCQNGHRILRTMPQIVHAIRAAQGAWVSLA